jgi:hypothetical protein
MTASNLHVTNLSPPGSECSPTVELEAVAVVDDDVLHRAQRVNHAVVDSRKQLVRRRAPVRPLQVWLLKKHQFIVRVRG